MKGDTVMAREPNFWFEVWDHMHDLDPHFVFGTEAERENYVELLNERAGYPDNDVGNGVNRFVYRRLTVADVKKEKPRTNGGIDIDIFVDDLQEEVRAIRLERSHTEMDEEFAVEFNPNLKALWDLADIETNRLVETEGGAALVTARRNVSLARGRCDWAALLLWSHVERRIRYRTTAVLTQA